MEYQTHIMVSDNYQTEHGNVFHSKNNTIHIKYEKMLTSF